MTGPANFGTTRAAGLRFRYPTRGTITINTATDVDSSSAPNNSLLVWNSGVSRYELKAFTDLAFDAGLMD